MKTEYDTDYASWAAKLLPEGARIRSRKHPQLTGVIKHYEWRTDVAQLSPIPYCVGWDDSALAHDILGWMFVYPHPDSIEPIP